jgi:hypothetical protein
LKKNAISDEEKASLRTQLNEIKEEIEELKK